MFVCFLFSSFHHSPFRRDKNKNKINNKFFGVGGVRVGWRARVVVVVVVMVVVVGLVAYCQKCQTQSAHYICWPMDTRGSQWLGCEFLFFL